MSLNCTDFSVCDFSFANINIGFVFVCILASAIFALLDLRSIPENVDIHSKVRELTFSLLVHREKN